MQEEKALQACAYYTTFQRPYQFNMAQNRPIQIGMHLFRAQGQGATSSQQIVAWHGHY